MLLVRRGNLIINGDFESGDVGSPPDDWTSENVVLVGAEQAFTGHQAAALGLAERTEPAILYQDVEICPLHRYQLSFQIGVFDGDRGPVIAQIRWLDACGTDLGTGLHVLIKGGPTPDIALGFWDIHVNVTDFAPLQARSARVLFTGGSTPESSCPTVLDSVMLTDIR